MREQQRLSSASATKARALPGGAPANAQAARERAEQLAQAQEQAAAAAGPNAAALEAAWPAGC